MGTKKAGLMLILAACFALAARAEDLLGYDAEWAAPATFTARWVFAADKVKLRSVPGTDGKVITLLEPGAKVAVLEKRRTEALVGEAWGFWLRVRTPAGDGWVFSAYMRTYDPLPVAAAPDTLAGAWIQPGGAKVEFAPSGDMYGSAMPGASGTWRLVGPATIAITPPAGSIRDSSESYSEVSITFLSSNRLVLSFMGMEAVFYRAPSASYDSAADAAAAE